MDISALAHRAQLAWFRTLAAAGFPQFTTGGGFAVSTGPDSNTENGAAGGLRELDALVDWLREQAVPASVLLTTEPSPETTARLTARGLIPERTGTNMGRLLTGAAPPAPDRQITPDWQITEVTGAAALHENQRVYAGDGWWTDLDQRVAIAARLGSGPGHPIRHWTAHHQGLPVGAATSFRFDAAVLLVHCCVAEPWRRRGIATALTRTRLAAAARDGATQAVLFPSPDGYQLHRSLGFQPAPVHPDRCFYLNT